jgi:hypothetical protein
MRWDHWEIFKGQRRAVFSYFVSEFQSKFRLYHCCTEGFGSRDNGQQTHNAAIRGLVYCDPSTGVISRLTIQAIDLPENLHIRESNTVIDYGVVNVGGGAYTLPTKALVFTRTDDGQKNRNEINFKNYRKFEAKSVLTFSDSEKPKNKVVK